MKSLAGLLLTLFASVASANLTHADDPKVLDPVMYRVHEAYVANQIHKELDDVFDWCMHDPRFLAGDVVNPQLVAQQVSYIMSDFYSDRQVDTTQIHGHLDGSFYVIEITWSRHGSYFSHSLKVPAL